MAVFSGRLFSRAHQFRGFLYFWKYAEFHNNGLSRNSVVFQCSKKFSSSQQETPLVKESLSENPINKITDLPNNEFEGKLLSVLQSINLKHGNTSTNLDKISKYLFKKNVSKNEVENVKNHPFFNQLCATLEETFVICTPQELYTNFKFARFFNLPETSLFVEKLMTLLLDKINLMSHFHLINILLSLSEFKSKTAESLTKAILVCLEHKQPLEHLNFNFASYYFSRKVIPEYTKKWMMQIIAENCEFDWSPLNWVSVIEGLETYTIQDENTARVVHKIRNHLTLSLNDSWSTKHLLDAFFCLLKIRNRDCKPPYIFDVLSYYLSKRSLNEVQICNLLYMLIINDHFNYSLYEKFCEKVKDKEFLQKLGENTQNMPLMMLMILSKLNFFDLDEATIANLKQLLENTNWLNISQNLNLIKVSKILIHLLSIKIYDKNLADSFYEFLIKDIDQVAKTTITERFTFLLYHYLSVFHPEDKPSLPADVLEKMKNLQIYTSKSHQFKDDVERVFGGEKNVVSKCFSPEGIYFDYAVAFTSDNTPMDLSNVQSSSGPVTIDPKTFPNDAKLVFIQLYNSRSFLTFSNTSVESIWKNISDQIYRKLNYNVISLYCKKFVHPLDFEKSEFQIRRAFEEEFGKIQNVNQ